MLQALQKQHPEVYARYLRKAASSTGSKARRDATCNNGRHWCSDMCVEDSSPLTCGSRCTPCPAPLANGRATCRGGKCRMACNSGFTLTPLGDSMNCTESPRPKPCLKPAPCQARQGLVPPVNGTCSKCTDGYPGDGCTCPTCIPGNTALTEDGCQLCYSGSNGTHCTDALCPMGYAPSKKGTCAACPPGSFSRDGNSTACTPCPPGTYQPLPGQDTCMKCFAAVDVIYQMQFFGSVALTDDTIGKTAPGNGSTSCDVACPAGTSSNQFIDGRPAPPAGQQLNWFCAPCRPMFRLDYFYGPVKAYAGGVATEAGASQCSPALPPAPLAGRGGAWLVTPRARTFLPSSGGALEQVEVATVRVGDVIQVVLEDGSLGLSKVFAMPHYQDTGYSQYFTLTTASGHRLQLSSSHYAYTAPTATSTWSQRIAVEGQSIQPGHVLWVVNAETGSLVQSEVTDVIIRAEAGAFVVCTLEGHAVVEGVAPSSYSSSFGSDEAMRKVAQAAKLVYYLVGDSAARWLHESGSINAVAAGMKAAFRALSAVKSVVSSELTRALLPAGSIV
ncbi:hypothetical protein OEZ85_012871 [Tetradesmus obliquus]|uniref:Hint domain-containing protein n=1 Tax=Tetradesmus obliquus TaxID=3088 RepID=A0ABY8U814_TETOB|nr:hypothetical protein OEZ85_012871 [Tetradesmus obliquus]